MFICDSLTYFIDESTDGLKKSEKNQIKNKIVKVLKKGLGTGPSVERRKLEDTMKKLR